jgi:histidyl-tRNA synthetase
MPPLFRAPKGVPDHIPPASATFLTVRDTLVEVLRLAGYGWLELPVFEDTELFARGVGASTDVVSKEMYTFTDKGDRSITLRPEGTAGALRAVLEHSLPALGLPVKVAYAGPMFRYERAQAGRFRQFQQVGAEAVGSEDAALDAELIWLGERSFRALGLSGHELLLNSLGSPRSREDYRAALATFLEGLDLDAETRERARLNPLRVLDDKRAQVLEQLTGAPSLPDSLSLQDRAHHDRVRQHLSDLGVAWTDAPRLVRGLDYYTRTTFEWVHPGLGAQSAIGGGGRYDGLAETLGGARLPGVGWALGLERIGLALQAEGVQVAPRALDVFVVPLGEQAMRTLVPIVAALRTAGLATDLCYAGPDGPRGVKGAMRAADRSAAPYVILVGDRDLIDGVAQVKDMVSGEQSPVALTGLLDHLSSHLSTHQDSHQNRRVQT